jgi:hypothetical protein
VSAGEALKTFPSIWYQAGRFDRALGLSSGGKGPNREVPQFARLTRRGEIDPTEGRGDVALSVGSKGSVDVEPSSCGCWTEGRGKVLSFSFRTESRRRPAQLAGRDDSVEADCRFGSPRLGLVSYQHLASSSSFKTTNGTVEEFPAHWARRWVAAGTPVHAS